MVEQRKKQRLPHGRAETPCRQTHRRVWANLRRAVRRSRPRTDPQACSGVAGSPAARPAGFWPTSFASQASRPTTRRSWVAVARLHTGRSHTLSQTRDRPVSRSIADFILIHIGRVATQNQRDATACPCVKSSWTATPDRHRRSAQSTRDPLCSKPRTRRPRRAKPAHARRKFRLRIPDRSAGDRRSARQPLSNRSASSRAARSSATAFRRSRSSNQNAPARGRRDAGRRIDGRSNSCHARA